MTSYLASDDDVLCTNLIGSALMIRCDAILSTMSDKGAKNTVHSPFMLFESYKGTYVKVVHIVDQQHIENTLT